MLRDEHSVWCITYLITELRLQQQAGLDVCVLLVWPSLTLLVLVVAHDVHGVNALSFLRLIDFLSLVTVRVVHDH